MTRRAAFQVSLEEARRIHLDASVIAYHLIGKPGVVELTRLVFASVREDRIRAQTSALVFYQLLAEPYRRGEEEVAARGFRYLSGLVGLDVVPVTGEIARQAAEVRARLGGSAERALHLATGLVGGARAYVTHKTALRRVAGMEIISLHEFTDG